MQEIAIVGGGNLAWHLGTVLQRIGKQVTILRRSPKRGEWPLPVAGYSWLDTYAPDLVFLAVPDDAIYMVSALLRAYLPPNTPIVHTSGATPISRIDGYFQQRGAFWPIRSLRQGEEVGDWQNLPLVYFGETEALTQVLGEVASELSLLTYSLNDEQRAQLHLSAVFSNNFVTWLYQISHELCTDKGIPFETLLPIIRNTALKQDGTAPRLTQTGAAARGDQETMKRHLSLLKGRSEYEAIYREFSRMIQEGTS
ncbi:MAG: Rossmann-like and DUF2520 domain-containing protein [Bacteroidota bacterium]